MKDIVKTCGDDAVLITDSVDGRLPVLKIKKKNDTPLWARAELTPTLATLAISALQEYIASQPGMQLLPSKKLLMDIDLGDLGERGVEVEYSAHGDEIEITDVRCEGVDIGKLVPDELEAKIIADIENEELEEERRLGL